MSTLLDSINSLADSVIDKRQTLDDALLNLQTWLDSHIETLTEDARTEFSKALNAEKDTQMRDGKPHGDDRSLVLSVLRLHTMRLLYRYDERSRPKPSIGEGTPYERARQRLQVALRQAEIAINEARVDTAVANAHTLLNDLSANRRWLQDALSRLQSIANKDLIRLAKAVPAPDLPPLTLFQKGMFWLFGIKQEEIARRNLQSLQQIAEMQHTQLVEMATLLAEAFNAVGDPIGGQQALSLLRQLSSE